MKKIVLLVLALGAFASVSGQAVPSINDPADVRSVGMGNSGIALPGSAYSVFNNTASLSLNDNTWGAGYTFGLWNPQSFEKPNRHALAGYYRFGKHTIAAGARYYMSKPAGVSEVGIPAETGSAFDMIGDLGYAYAINEYMGVSATVRYINSKLNSDAPGLKNGTAFAGDLGFYFRRNGLSAAFSLSNLGTKINFGGKDESLGSWVKAGAGYALQMGEKSLLTGSLQLGYQISGMGLFNGGLGVEYMFNNMIAARVGYNLLSGKAISGDGSKGETISGANYATAGLGFNFKGFSLNAAYLLGGSMDGTLMLGLEARF